MSEPKVFIASAGHAEMEQRQSAEARLEIAIALVWKGPRLLITRRAAGAHLAGLWEFPGGKREPNESLSACAEREVLEEVGISCRAERLRKAICHDYADRRLVLTPVDCIWQHGEPQCLGVDACAWITPPELSNYAFPEANASLIAAIEREPRP
jgi:mutator protein MutT